MENLDSTQIESLHRLTRDIKQASVTLAPAEVRYLVDAYYQMQENRKAAENQVRALTTSGEPHEVIRWLADNAALLERNVKAVLDVHTSSTPIGRWAKSVVGIGPVIAAGLAAHIDITKAPTVGHIWRFAGLDPTMTWEKGEKRPWNADLRTLCWKVGQSFMKVSNRENDFYGHLWRDRKAREETKNLAGAFVDQARAKLERFKIDKKTDAWKWYAGCLTPEAAHRVLETTSEQRAALLKKLAGPAGSGQPMLPLGHIDARARRWTVKLFLSHWWEVAYELHHGTKPPNPYVITYLEHVDQIRPPNWPMTV